MRRKPDLRTTWTQSLFLVQPVTERGQHWLCDNLDFDYLGDLLPVDHRCIENLIMGAVADGLAVQDSTTGRFATQGK